jgi:hypothetical protein
MGTGAAASASEPDFLSLLLSFLLSSGAQGQKYPIHVFVAACSILGFLAVVMDLCFFAIKKSSLFDFKYTLGTSFIIIFGWSIGAAITGFIGSIFNVLQVSLLACATAGIGWPVIAAKMIKEKTSPAAQEPAAAQKAQHH